MQRRQGVSTFEFEFDLGGDEMRRRVEMLHADPGWDPAEQIAGEDEAYALLYSGLDPEQAAVHRQLVEAGVLPPRVAAP
jgi:hypothetical protein